MVADENLDERVGNTLRRASVTKANACCLWVLLQEKSPDVVRSKLQAEIREIRAGGLKESVILHPVLWARSRGRWLARFEMHTLCRAGHEELMLCVL